MRQNSIGLREAELNLITTEACSVTYCTMLEMGGATSNMMKVRGATKSNSRNYIR